MAEETAKIIVEGNTGAWQAMTEYFNVEGKPSGPVWTEVMSHDEALITALYRALDAGAVITSVVTERRDQ